MKQKPQNVGHANKPDGRRKRAPLRDEITRVLAGVSGEFSASQVAAQVNQSYRSMRWLGSITGNVGTMLAKMFAQGHLSRRLVRTGLVRHYLYQKNDCRPVAVPKVKPRPPVRLDPPTHKELAWRQLRDSMDIAVVQDDSPASFR